jgi:hypothetical protein
MLACRRKVPTFACFHERFVRRVTDLDLDPRSHKVQLNHAQTHGAARGVLWNLEFWRVPQLAEKLRTGHFLARLAMRREVLAPNK